MSCLAPERGDWTMVCYADARAYGPNPLHAVWVDKDNRLSILPQTGEVELVESGQSRIVGHVPDWKAGDTIDLGPAIAAMWPKTTTVKKDH